MEMILPLPHWHAPTLRHLHFISWLSTNQRSRKIESLLFGVGVDHENATQFRCTAGRLTSPAINKPVKLLGLGSCVQDCSLRGPNSEPSSRVNRMGNMLL